MGLVFQQFLDAAAIYVCRSCRAHLAAQSDVISRAFQGRLGQAYLVEAVVNERLGASEERMLMTGLHTVCDLYCRRCDALVGWKYMCAHDRSQRYKEGRYVLEQSQLVAAEQHAPNSLLLLPPLEPLPPLRPRPVAPDSPRVIDNALVLFLRNVGIQADEPTSSR
ncbi:hypothetical protein H4R21_003443 [Coemansia helicoidea]|uniref:Uncharacterized protein n=1 Tax=Coemansia helicoidea TaxID=1286919 RepID=A0ACC1L2L9_9FUNG|nr:hypothetical protein H4R21_003443 [Coemansia helicoidea]